MMDFALFVLFCFVFFIFFPPYNVYLIYLIYLIIWNLTFLILGNKRERHFGNAVGQTQRRTGFIVRKDQNTTVNS